MRKKENQWWLGYITSVEVETVSIGSMRSNVARGQGLECLKIPGDVVSETNKIIVWEG